MKLSNHLKSVFFSNQDISLKTFCWRGILPYAVTAILIGVVIFIGNFPYCLENRFYEIPLWLAISFIPIAGGFASSFLLQWKGFSRAQSMLWLGLGPLISFYFIESLNDVNIFQYPPAVFWINLLSYAVVYGIVFLISYRIRLSIWLPTLLFVFYGLVDYFVGIFRGSFLFPWDITSIGTALTIISEYHFELNLHLTFSLGMVLLYLVSSFHVRDRWNERPDFLHSLIVRAAVLCNICIYLLLSNSTPFLESLGIYENFWNQASARELNGVWVHFLSNIKYSIVSHPSGYSVDAVYEIISSNTTELLAENNAETRSDVSSKSSQSNRIQNPNIIVIMNESFSDLTIINDFQTNRKVTPFIDQLEENTIRGNVYVSVFGARTSNSEFEMLTGNSMAFLPQGSVVYDQFVKEPSLSLANILDSDVYSKIAFHPYFPENWSRDKVYPLYGFNEFFDLLDAQPMDLLRSFPSDYGDYNKVIELYEDSLKDRQHDSLFLFNVTMQNHGSYNDSNYEPTIRLRGMEGEYPLTEQYLSLIHESDKQFEQLLDYFSEQEEPTIVLMFGDHQPAVENEFYEELYGKPIEDLTLEELQRRYITPFILWANYDIPKQKIDAISLNYLSTLLMETAGMELPAYNQFLKDLYQTIPVINANGYMDHDGNHYALNEQSEYSELLRQYQILQYNNMFDTKNRADELFGLEQTASDPS